MEMIGICTPAAISRVGTCTAACAKTAMQPSAARRPSMAINGKLLQIGTEEETAAGSRSNLPGCKSVPGVVATSVVCSIYAPPCH